MLAQLIEERTRALCEEQALATRLREVDLAKTEYVAVASTGSGGWWTDPTSRARGSA